MDQNERQVIDELFTKLRQAEQRSGGARDADAERQIAAALAQQPAAPYYMSQVILVQEQALNAMNQRVQDLERELAERPAAGSGGGFLSGLFGGGATAQPQRPVAAPAQRLAQRPAQTAAQPGAQAASWPANPPPAGRGWGGAPQPGMGMAPGATGGGGGFLATAASTAMGVAGGVLLANALTGLFAGDEAQAAEAAAAAEPEQDPGLDEPPMDEPMMDDGGDFGSFEEF